MIFRVLTILIFVINHYVNVYGQISIDSTLILIEKTRYSSADSSYKILQNLENNKVTSKQKALINEMKADIQWYKGKFESSIHLYNLNIEIYDNLKDSLLIGHTLADIGYVYMDMRKFSKSLNHYQKAFEIAIKYNDENLIYLTTTYKAQLNEKLGYHDKALQAYKDALNSDIKKNNNRNVAIIYNNISSLYLNKEDYTNAIIYAEKSWSIWKSLKDKNGLANYNTLIGVANQFLGKYKLAEKHLLISEKLNLELGKKMFLADVYLSLVMIYSKSNQLNKANEYLEKVRPIVHNSPNLKLLSDYYLTLKNYFEVQRIYDSAYYYSEKEKNIKDSILNIKKQEQITLQSEEFDSKKKENDIRLLKAEHERDQLLIDQRNSQLIFSVVGGTIFLLLSIIAFKSFRAKKAANYIVSEKNEELNQSNEELAAQRDEIESQKNQVEEAHKKITDSIIYAKRIQNAILPSPSVINECIPESMILYKPKDVVAGDFYWIEKVENKVFFAAADCTGHGVPGAMVSVICHNAMNRAVREFGLTDPGFILDKTRELVVSEFEKSEDDVKDGMDIALCSINGSTLQYAGAHNPLWIVRSISYSEGVTKEELHELIEVKADIQPIGKFDNPVPYTTHTIELEKDDSIYIFSDGYADQFGGEKDKKFGSKQFKDVLMSIQDKPMKKQKEILKSTFEDWIKVGGGEQIDDVCVMGIKN